MMICFGWLFALKRTLSTLSDSVASRADFIKLQALVDTLIIEAKKPEKRSDVIIDGWNFSQHNRRNTQPLVRAWRER
jgi:hypothetical protein